MTVSGLYDVIYTIGLINLKNLVEQHKTLRQSAAVLCSVLTYIHTYMKFITRCTVEDGSNRRRVLSLGGGV